MPRGEQADPIVSIRIRNGGVVQAGRKIRYRNLGCGYDRSRLVSHLSDDIGGRQLRMQGGNERKDRNQGCERCSQTASRVLHWNLNLHVALNDESGPTISTFGSSVKASVQESQPLDTAPQFSHSP